MSSWDEGISTSSISTTPPTTGCHMLKIDGYSKTKVFRREAPFMSSKFEAAGQPWCIIYYPNGSLDAGADDITIHIEYLGSSTINAKIRFSLVPHNNGGEQAPYSKTFVADFGRGRTSRSRRFPCFIRKEELETLGYLLDDCFAIRCDIEVVGMSAVADPAVDAHDLERLALPCSCDDGQCKRFHDVREPPVVPAAVKRAACASTARRTWRHRRSSDTAAGSSWQRGSGSSDAGKSEIDVADDTA